MTGIVLIYSTWPDPDEAEAAGRRLITERLCACVNIMPPVRSIHRWKEEVKAGEETPMLVKTTVGLAAAARDRIMAIHPYDVPAIIELPAGTDGTLPAFADWVRAEVREG